MELVVYWFLFVELILRWFRSWNLLHVGLYLRETCTLFFLLSKLILLMEHVKCWLLFVEVVVCWFLFVKLAHCFFSSWNLYIDFSSLETNFSQRTYWMLIFVRGSWCMLIFDRESCCMLIFLFMKLVCWFFSTWNRFFPETCCVVIFCSRNLILFMKLAFSSGKLHTDFSLHETDFVHETCSRLGYTWGMYQAWWNLYLKYTYG